LFNPFSLLSVLFGAMGDENQEKSNKSLVNFLLNGDNYLTWARAMKLALGGQSKIQHIFGKTETVEELPEDATETDKIKAQKEKKKKDEE
jgi:gag-polypeptide of LTR copia-type